MTAELRAGFIKELRNQCASVIADAKSYDVPSLCLRYGLADGDESEAFAGKYRYAHKRLLVLDDEALISVARQIAKDDGNGELVRMLGQLNAAPAREPPPSAARLGTRQYYSVRTGRNPEGTFSFEIVRTLFKSQLRAWADQGYLQEQFGYNCVDDGFVPGKLGDDIAARMLFSLHKAGLWPILDTIDEYSEDDFFDVVEFLFDHVSKPLTGSMHSYAGCGMHWRTFDQVTGQAEYWAATNQLLSKFGDGYELTTTGEVLAKAPHGMEPLLTTSVPSDDDNVRERVNGAIRKFRRRSATIEDRRDAVRDLADVLEYLRPKLAKVLTKKDDGTLFEIANNFGVRHHNPAQKTDYDLSIWLSWMFYFYLSTIHAGLRFIDKQR